MNENNSRKFAEVNFKKIPELYQQWNILHVKYMVKAIEELSKSEEVNISRLRALAWVHDIGKIEDEQNHAEVSVEILEKEFDLDEIDRDCILNHGSSGKPKSKEAKIFQCADGLSLFYPEMVLFRFWVEAREGLNFEEIKEKIKGQFKKYVKVYSENKIAIDLLKNKYFAFFNTDL